RRVGHHEADRIDGRTQLFGYDLCQGRTDVLPDFRLAGVDGNDAVLADVQPGRQVLRRRVAEAAAAPGAGFPLLRREGSGRNEQQDAATENLEEVSSFEIETVTRRFAELVAFHLDHRAPPFVAASRIACMILGYVPQRQTLPSKARTISSRVGFGRSRSK